MKTKKLLLILSTLTSGLGLISSSAIAGTFDSLKYRVVGSCQNPSELGSIGLSSHAFISLGRDANQKMILASLYLQLFQDGTYWGEYQEGPEMKCDPGTSLCFEVSEIKKLSGTYIENGPSILLSGLGSGSIITYEGKQAVQMKFDQGAVNGHLENRTEILVQSVSSELREGESIAHYCHL